MFIYREQLFSLFNRSVKNCRCETVVHYKNWFVVVQECRTWLNVASNQELNKASYETVRQSYTAALECARQACDAKLEVFYAIVTDVTCNVR